MVGGDKERGGTSRQDRGGMRNSASPGYWERKLMEAPLSTSPAAISSTVPRFLATPLYAEAVVRSVVVDMSPNSTAASGREAGEGGRVEWGGGMGNHDRWLGAPQDTVHGPAESALPV